MHGALQHCTLAIARAVHGCYFDIPPSSSPPAPTCVREEEGKVKKSFHGRRSRPPPRLRPPPLDFTPPLRTRRRDGGGGAEGAYRTLSMDLRAPPPSPPSTSPTPRPHLREGDRLVQMEGGPSQLISQPPPPSNFGRGSSALSDPCRHRLRLSLPPPGLAPFSMP